MSSNKQAIGALITLGSIDASVLLIKVKVHWDGAGGVLHEVEVRGDVGICGWYGCGEEREESNESGDDN